MAIDQANDKLYITHGQVTPCFATFNFVTNEWKVFCNTKETANNYNMDRTTANRKLLVLPGSRLHLFRRSNYSDTPLHIAYNRLQQNWNPISKIGLKGIEYLDTRGFIFVKLKIC